MTGTLTKDTSLGATDRCDRCGARAYVRVVLPGGDLLFCGHHAAEHEAAFRKIAVEILDAREDARGN